MALDLGVMGAVVTLDDGDYNRKMNGLPQTAETNFKKIAQLAATYLSARALWSFTSSSVKAFSDMEEAGNRFDVVYGKIRDSAQESLGRLREEFGLSNQSAQDMLASTGDLLTGFGFSQRASLELAEATARLGVDLYSFTNYAGGAKGATEAITKAMLGETEQVKALGIVIRQDSLEYQNLVKHFMETTGASLLQAKALTALEIATRQSINAIGDWNRPGLTFAQAQQKMTETTKEFKAEIGAEYQSSLKSGIVLISGLMEKFNDADPSMQRLTVRAVELSAALLLVGTSAGQSANASIAKAASALIPWSKLSQTLAEREAKAVEASEKAKEAAGVRSTATRDLLEKKRHLTVMQNAAREASAVFQSANATRSMAMSVGPLPRGQQRGLDQNVIGAEKAYAAAKMQVVKANAAYVVSANAAKAARAAEVAQTTVAVTANNAVAASATLAGKAMIMMKASAVTLVGGLKALFAALGPIGVALIAVAGANELYDRYRRRPVDIAVDAGARASKGAQTARDRLAERDELRSDDLKKIARLQELAKAQKLNSAELKEAAALNDQLTKSRGISIAAIDEATGSMTIQKKAVDSLNKAMSEAREKELDKRLSAEQEAFSRLQAAGKTDELAAQQKRIDDARKALEDFRATGNLTGETQRDRNAAAAELSTAQKSAMEALKNARLESSLALADVEEKAAIMDAKLAELKAKQFEAVGNREESTFSEEELKRQKEITELERDRLEMKREQDEIAQKMRDEEIESQIERNRAEQQKQIDRKIAVLERDGDSAGVRAILSEQLAKAKAAAATLARSFEAEMAKALPNGITKAEKETLDKVKALRDQAAAEEQKWADKVYEHDFDQSGKQQKVVGDFSAALLAAMIGANDPAKETAKHTKESAKTLRKIEQKTSTVQGIKYS